MKNTATNSDSVGKYSYFFMISLSFWPVGFELSNSILIQEKGYFSARAKKN